MFRPVSQADAPVGRQITLFGRVRQVAAPGRSLPSATESCSFSEFVRLANLFFGVWALGVEPVEDGSPVRLST